MKAVGYVRVSTDKQSRDGLSLAAQESAIRSYCELYRMALSSLEVCRLQKGEADATDRLRFSGDPGCGRGGARRGRLRGQNACTDRNTTNNDTQMRPALRNR